MNMLKTKKCLFCDKVFQKRENATFRMFNKQKFCSNKCKAISEREKTSLRFKGIKKPPRTEQWKEKQRLAHLGQISGNKGKKASEETRKRISEGHKGQKAWNKGLTKETSISIKRMAESRVGLNNPIHTLPKEKRPNYKGGITPLNFQIRHSLEYVTWRKQVFERDDYRCFDCGERGGKLEADHIYSFAYYPRLRFEILNGQTLCRNCHIKKTIFERTGRMELKSLLK